MKIEQFTQALSDKNIELNENQLNQFARYYDLLIEWNKKMNLTAITEEKEVYLKHFFDSISSSFYYDFTKVNTVCDIGAVSGFHSIFLKLYYDVLEFNIVM